jgi:hypothetical protein
MPTRADIKSAPKPGSCGPSSQGVSPRATPPRAALGLCLCLLAVSLHPGFTAAAADIQEELTTELPGLMRTKQGTVSFQAVQKPEQPAKEPQPLDFGDTLRTHALSRAAVTLTNRSDLYLSELTRLTIVTEMGGQDYPTIDLRAGRARVLSRGKPATTPFRTPQLAGINRGTEFLLEVEPGRTVVTLFDGEAEVSNADTPGPVRVRPGQQGIAVAGKPIEVRAVIAARNIVQWWVYYPGILDPEDLGLTPDEETQLAASLQAYRTGDLLAALKQYPGYPDPVAPRSEAQRQYLAGLLLSVGAVDRSESLLAEVKSSSPLARTLQSMITAVAGTTATTMAGPDLLNPETPKSSSERLALSYAHQATNNLKAALAAARSAVAGSPRFGFGWARVAELEFSFGHTRAAREAVAKALVCTPRNAQAHALQGFLFAAENHSPEAITAFTEAIRIDPGLGNAWLGRGLCKRRLAFRSCRGAEALAAKSAVAPGEAQRDDWLSDLRTAALLEPSRSLLRSYLGKAFGDAGLTDEALKELAVAKHFDPNDPTPWLYSALLQRDENRIADAIHDLEKSQQLNDNRAVYRSRLLLDQDQAVRSANLASLYADAGMSDVSERESARAVTFDYANYSAHLNLADSFNQLRDPTRFNLRYESEWFNEHLLASLLAPVGAGSLSQNLSQQEYSQLFAGKRFGLNGTTEYFGNGEWRQTASQFGTLGNTSYALDLEYQHKDGVRVNNDLARIEWYSRIKQQITPEDSLLVLAKYQDYDAGDNYQYYDPAAARPAFRFEETQTPLLLAGWHHEWAPGVHTLFLGGRLVNDQHVSDTNVNQRLAIVNPAGMFDPTSVVPFDLNYHSQFETYTAELNQIFQRERHTDILGARFQDGVFKAQATLDNPPPPYSTNGFFTLPEDSATDAEFRRLSFYAYHHWELVDGLMLIGGVAYDVLDYPSNFRRPSLESDESHTEQWSPKAALIWDLTPRVRVRGMFSQAVGGVSYDESVRLEPTQLAGFSQSFRSVISESLVGSVEAPEYQIAGGAVDLRPWTNAWLSLQGEQLQEHLSRDAGLFALDFFGAPPGTPAHTTEQLDYREWQARAVFNQMLGRDWFLEVQYQFTRSELDRGLPTIPATPGYERNTTTEADLHEVRLAATWRHPSGFFARGEFWWFLQELDGSTPQPPGDDFPQVNLYAGYRFPKRSAELTVGGLNLTDEDYHLSPLNYYLELPRERVFYLRFRFNF